MIERLIEPSVRNRWLVIAAGALLALGGVLALFHTPVDAIPDLSENQVIVFTEWPGHSPPEIEAQVTYPLSLHLQGLEDVRVVRSSSDVNFSMISVIFEDGVAFAAARDRVAQRLPLAREAMPAGVEPSLAPDAAATGQIFWYTVEGSGLDLARLRDIQDWYVLPQLRSVPGVAEVASVGGYAREYVIELDPRRLRALGVSLPDVLHAVARSNTTVGGGVIHTVAANEAVMAVLPVFEAQMREFAYQHNLDFESRLGHRLIRTARTRLVELLRQNGSLLRSPRQFEQARLAEEERRSELERGVFPLQFARDLTVEDVARLTRDSVQRMEELGLLRPGSDPYRYRPGPLSRAAGAIDRLLGGNSPDLFGHLHDLLTAERLALWREHLAKLNSDLTSRAATVFTLLCVEELVLRAPNPDPAALSHIQERRRPRLAPAADIAAEHHHHGGAADDDPSVFLHYGMKMNGGNHQHVSRVPTVPALTPPPVLARMQEELNRHVAERLQLRPVERGELAGLGGELDRTMQMPGWTNVWTMPIQNRVDMLSTGVNTTVGVRVLGRRLEDVIRASEDVAVVLGKVPGAANVVADRLRGKGYLRIRPDRARAARLGVSVADVSDVIEVALGGKTATRAIEGRERHAVRVRYTADWRADEESPRELPVPVLGKPGQYVRLGDVADVRIVEGPAAIKSENGLLRNYVRLNVRDRESGEFVEEARRLVAARVELPPGVYLEWTGQFEHEQRAHDTLLVIMPIVVILIFLVLWLTYHDLADAVLMMLAVPGALAGGVFAQWLFGYKFSVTVWVGYIACFGMATATGIIMLVYLREAVARAGGLESLSLEQLRQAVMDGAVHRLRPKLLTECTMVLGLAPLLWTSGVGAEVIKPMVGPVLGGILIADEVIDLFLPMLFYWERRRRWEQLRRGHRMTKGAPERLEGAIT